MNAERRKIPKHVTSIARKLRQEMTEAELMLWERIRNRQLSGLRFRTQHPIWRFVADFYCHTPKMVIELDGPIHDHQQEYDHNRDKYLMAKGCTILRFTNEQVVNDMESVLKTVILTATKLENAPP